MLLQEMEATNLTFKEGDQVWYEVRNQRGDDFRVRAKVVDLKGTRVIIEFSHWADGRKVQRRVQPHRLVPRPS